VKRVDKTTTAGILGRGPGLGKKGDGKIAFYTLTFHRKGKGTQMLRGAVQQLKNGGQCYHEELREDENRTWFLP